MTSTLSNLVEHFSFCTGCPRKNVTKITLYYKVMKDWIKLLFIAFDRKTLQVLFDTMIINFRSGVLILWSFSQKVVIWKIGCFCGGNYYLQHLIGKHFKFYLTLWSLIFVQAFWFYGHFSEKLWFRKFPTFAT